MANYVVVDDCMVYYSLELYTISRLGSIITAHRPPAHRSPRSMQENVRAVHHRRFPLACISARFSATGPATDTPDGTSPPPNFITLMA